VKVPPGRKALPSDLRACGGFECIFKASKIIKTVLRRWIGPEKRSKCPAMYSAKRRMLLYREDQGIDLGTPEYLVFQVLSRSNCRLPMLTTPHAAV
jgi:hypothetical protein